MKSTKEKKIAEMMTVKAKLTAEIMQKILESDITNEKTEAVLLKKLKIFRDVLFQDMNTTNTSIAPKIDFDESNLLYNGYLNPKYTFDNFVVGLGNKLIFDAAEAIADKPGKLYNPFFIHGGVGLGKTHIMKAIGNKILEKYPDKKVYYTSCENFMEEMIQAIQNRKTFEFRQKYRMLDVLLVDDIQFIQGKESTQEEFLHIFNSLFDEQKQIIITSDRFPKKLENIDETLKLKFTWGMVTDISAPDLKTRIAILKRKIAEENIITVPDEVISFIAEHIKSSIYELEGALIKITATSLYSNEEITTEFAKKCLSSFM